MKILIISGFLGAGKTTFIKTLADKTKRDFVVLENEYGKTGIDGAVLRESGGMNIYELTEGCVCCSMKDDFAESVLTIANTFDPEYLIVEPTGLARLGNLIANIKRIEYERIAILNPITLFDGKAFFNCMREYGEVCAGEIEAASKILITKMEHGDAGDLARIEKVIRSRNSHARLLLTHYSEQPLEWWTDLLSDYLDPAIEPQVSTDESPEMESLALTRVSLVSPTHLIAFLEGVVFGVFGRIERAKGFLPCGISMLRFDVVNQTYAVTGMESQAGDKPGCIFIGTGLKRAWLREALQR